MKKLLVVAIACLFVAGFSATAKAISLPPGGSTNGPFGASLLPGSYTVVATLSYH